MTLQHFFEGDPLDRDGLNAIVDDLTANDANEVPTVFINRAGRKSYKSSAGQKVKIQSEIVAVAPYTTSLGYVEFRITFPEPFGIVPAVTFTPIGREVFMIVITQLTNTYFTVRCQQNPTLRGDTLVNITGVGYVAIGAA